MSNTRDPKEPILDKNGKVELTPDQLLMIRSMQQNYGIVTKALKAAHVSNSLYYRWLKKCPKFKKAIEDVEDYALDFVEDALLKNIKKGDKTCIIFYLKCKGKRRGYIEKQEIEHSAINIQGLREITAAIKEY